MGKYEDIKVGDKAEIKHTVTQSDIENFVELSGDDNKIHLDEEFVAKTSFKKPIAHGMLGVSFISTILGTKLPGHGSVWVSQNLEFLLPVRVGDEITIKAEVLKKMDRGGLIELQTDIFNQNNQKVTTGVAKAKFIPFESEPEEQKNAGANVVLVVGATGGVGSATCVKLAANGFDVAVHYFRDREAAKRIQTEITTLGRKAILVGADITDSSQVKVMVDAVLEKFGSLSAVVNCATSQIPQIKFEDIKWDLIQQHIDVHVKGSFNLMKEVVPVMEKNKYGKIVMIAAQVADALPVPQWLPYITAKSALNGFSKALAVELALKGIRVNIVSPGMTNTNLISTIPEKDRLIIASKTPLRRIALANDIANAILFLVSPDSDYITGETIRINGGQVMV
jgi:3-oxoacyl-[acyl-carrier protein] reductase